MTAVPNRRGHDRKYAIDEREGKSQLGYSPAQGFAENFTKMLMRYLGNEMW